VPGDVSLVSIGDLHAFSSIEPPVTSVGHPYEELGRRAAQRLVARLDGTAEQVRIERLPPVVSERASVGPAPA
ncbi:MAG: substrate-binding domain-containing protein, partial [Planctomycetes bacterium]|nr:substrate-binding domain-containing protein [Planctomycetota bacterium]